MARGRHRRTGRLPHASLASGPTATPTERAVKKPITPILRATRLIGASLLVGLSFTSVLVLSEQALASHANGWRTASHHATVLGLRPSVSCKGSSYCIAAWPSLAGLYLPSSQNPIGTGKTPLIENGAALSNGQNCSNFSPGADLEGCNLTGADLAGVDLAGANLFNADLTSANLSGATLTAANLTDTNLDEATLNGVISGGIIGSPSALPSGWSLVNGYLVGPSVTHSDTVTNCSGSASDVGSLPYVVKYALSGDTISFSVTCPASSPITLAGTIDLNTDVTIDGPGSDAIVLDGVNLSGSTAINTSASVTATISGITVMNADPGFNPCLPEPPGNIPTGCGPGGAVVNQGVLTISNSTFTGDRGYNGVIQNFPSATLHVTDSTFSNNTGYLGGGIGGAGIVTVSNSTFAGDSGAILLFGGSLNISNSTFWGNNGFAIQGVAPTVTTLEATIVANTAGRDCESHYVDGGYNLDDDGSCGFTNSTSRSDESAGLDSAGLQNNGGPTQTIALQPGSSAIGAVNSASLCSTPDQRGVARSLPCDIGAFQTTGLSQQNCATTGAGASLEGCDLSEDNLTSANLAGADLVGVDLFNADLTGANLSGATLTNANLTDANLDGAILTGVISGGIVGTPSALPSGWSVVGGNLVDS